MLRLGLLAVWMVLTGNILGCDSSQKPLDQLSMTELEAEFSERLKLHDVNLMEQESGVFTGTGVDAEGKVIQLEVKQEPRQISWKNTYKAPDGSVTTGEGVESW